MKMQVVKTIKTNPVKIFEECVSKLDDKSWMSLENIVGVHYKTKRKKNNLFGLGHKRLILQRFPLSV